MKAEFSHSGFLNSAQYTGVQLQQGRLLTDRDSNAFRELQKARQNALGQITFNSGVPRSGGLLTGVNTGTAQFAPRGGTVVAGGRLGKLLPQDTREDFGYYNQFDLNVSAGDFTPGILYVDIFEDNVSSYEDNDLRDEALHGADTVTASRQYEQVKRCDIGLVEQNNCGSVFKDGVMPQIGTGEFSVDLRIGTGIADDCDPCANEVTLDQTVDNSLFRMEVQAVTYSDDGTPLTVTLVWSHENGGIIFPQTATTDIFNSAYSFEYYTPQTQSRMGIPAEGFDSPLETSSIFHGSVTARSVDPNALVRRWDGYAIIDIQTFSVEGWDKGTPLQAGSNTHGGVSDTSDGYIFNLDQLIVTLNLKTKAILIGDYWHALLRSASGTARALSSTPRGIKHDYCILGYSEDGINISINPADLSRLQSPDLSCLHADTIHYTASTDCSYAEGATNVEDALNAFCRHIGQLYNEVAAPVPEPTTYPHIKSIKWERGAPFKNDWWAYKNSVESGFIVEFSEAMQMDYISDDVVTMVVDMPRTLAVNPNDPAILSSTITPVIIPGSVTSVDTNSKKMLFVPDPEILANAYTEIQALKDSDYNTFTIKVRIAINGRFLFAKKDNRPSDSFIPGKPVAEVRKQYVQRFGPVIQKWVTESPDVLPDNPLIMYADKKRRIALDFDQAGIRTPSKFKAWFYVDLRDEPQNVTENEGSNRDVVISVDPNTRIDGSYDSQDNINTKIAGENTAISGENTAALRLYSVQQPADTPPEAHLNLHTMSSEQLIAVNGIGKTTANRIIKYRKDHLILGRESLLEAGINNSTINRFIDLVCF